MTLLLALIIPFLIILAVVTIVDVLRHHYRGTTKALWIVLVILLPVVGSIVYWLTAGRPSPTSSRPTSPPRTPAPTPSTRRTTARGSESPAGEVRTSRGRHRVRRPLLVPARNHQHGAGRAVDHPVRHAAEYDGAQRPEPA